MQTYLVYKFWGFYFLNLSKSKLCKHVNETYKTTGWSIHKFGNPEIITVWLGPTGWLNIKTSTYLRTYGTLIQKLR